MNVLTVLGVLIGSAALGLAIIALNRAAPTFSVGPPVSGQYEIWHNGPNGVVVRRAYVQELDAEYEINTERSGVEMDDIDGFPFPPPHSPFGRGATIPPHRRYYITANVNR